MAKLQWKVLLIYLNDIIVFDKTVAEGIQRLQMVFQRLRKVEAKEVHSVPKQSAVLRSRCQRS